MGRLKWILMVMVLVSMNVLAWTSAPWLQDDPRRRQQRTTLPQEGRAPLNPLQGGTLGKGRGEKKDSSLFTLHSSLLIDDEEIPDSLLNPRWKIQRTQPITQEDLKRGAADLMMPQNIEQKVVFSRDGDCIWQCRNCGHIHVGKQAPEVCPVCKHPQAYFELKKENY